MDDQTMMARLQKALDIGQNAYQVEDIIAAIRSGAMQCFHKPGAFIVTEIGVYPHRKVLTVLIACGELEAVMSLQPDLEAFGREHGCDYLTMMGRRGWSAVLPKHGWRESHVVYSMPLEPVNV